MPAVGPFPDWDDPEDIRWGLLPFALLRNLASLVIGHDPVTERYQRKVAKESQETFDRLSKVERRAYDELRGRHLPSPTDDG